MSARDDVQRWRDPSWWAGWNRLTVSEGSRPVPQELGADTRQRLLGDLREEGWCMHPRPYKDDLVERLHQGVYDLRKRRLPAAFIWVFDETWHLFGRMDPLWRHVLGDNYRVLPCFWAWYIPKSGAKTGWEPHRDRSKGAPNVKADGTPLTLTSWIPLSRATPNNGCMYIVPAAHTAPSRKALNPRDARALPANPGDVLAWRQDVWHWGGRSSRYAEEPRVSVGLEFQAGRRARFNKPLIAPMTVPTLDHRLALLGANLKRYQRFVRNPKLPPLARALMAVAPELDHGKVAGSE